jgi:hypothetical protein
MAAQLPSTKLVPRATAAVAVVAAVAAVATAVVGVAAAVAAAVVASAGKVLRPTAYASIDYPVVRKSRLNRTGPLTPSSCQRAL